MSAGGDAVLLECALDPSWESVTFGRDETIAAISAEHASAREAEYVGMIAHELLENAVRYGEWGRADETIGLVVRAGAGEVTLEVTCPSSPARIKKLESMLGWLAGFGSPRDAYEARVRELAEEADPQSSRLGLARILAEGRCHLETSLDAGTLRVRATVRAERAE